MNSANVTSSSLPYDLRLASNFETSKRGLTAEKVASLEAALQMGNFKEFTETILGLPETIQIWLPPLGVPAHHLELWECIHDVGIYTLFPQEMVRWITFHVKKNVLELTKGECERLHKAFCRSHLFSGNEPDSLAFLLASPVFRMLQKYSNPAPDKEYDPKLVLSFIHRREVPLHTTFKEAVPLIHAFRYWQLGDYKEYFFGNDIARFIDVTKDASQAWVEMLEALEQLHDDDFLKFAKNEFYEKVLNNGTSKELIIF